MQEEDRENLVSLRQLNHNKLEEIEHSPHNKPEPHTH